MSAELSDRVREWEAAGETERFRDRAIHVYQRDGTGTPLLLLHGFPSSSYDWSALLAREEADSPVVAFDFLGFGLSDKPRDHLYTLAWQADLAEELVRRRYGDRAVFVVAHDMGTSVMTELLARDVEGSLGFDLAGALLFNGSVVLECASLSRGQRLLRGRLGPLAARMTSKPVFKQEFARLFTDRHPLTDDEADDQWALVCHNAGRTMGHKLIHYLDERERFASRWHGAVRDWEGPLSFMWGVSDPIATTSVLDALVELRPAAPVERLELGHYPQIEDPAQAAAAMRRAVGRAA